MHRLHRPLVLFATIIAFLVGTVGAVGAQATDIPYGTFATGSLNVNTPARFFTFTGVAGDEIVAEVVTLSSGFDPRATLLLGSRTIITSLDDPFQPGKTDAVIRYQLLEDGQYTLLVEGQNATVGQFLLRLSQRNTSDATPLTLNSQLPINLSPQQSNIVYSFDSNVGDTVTVSSALRGFGFVSTVLDPNGNLLSVHASNLMQGAQTVVAPQTGTYTLEVRSLNPNSSGVLTLTFTNSAASAEGAVTSMTAPDTAPVPAATTDPFVAPIPTPVLDPTAAPIGIPTTADQPAQDAPATGPQPSPTPAAQRSDTIPADRCTVTPTGGGVIIRQGPSTDTPQISSIVAGGFRFAEATNGVWIRLQGGGWVSSGVVTLNGPCSLDQVSGSGTTTTTTTTDPTAVPPTAAPVVAPIGGN